MKTLQGTVHNQVLLWVIVCGGHFDELIRVHDNGLISERFDVAVT